MRFSPGEVRSATTKAALAALVWLVCVTASNSALAQQLAFELSNPAGEAVVVRPGDSKLTAVCFLGAECPMAKAYATRLNELQQLFADQGVRIVGVFSNHQDSAEDIAEYIDAQQVQFATAHDVGNRIADQFGATRTPEVFLLDEALKLRYHGRIDDQYAPGVARSAAVQQDLRDAIEALLAGKPVRIPETIALGCIIGRVPQVAMRESAGIATEDNTAPGDDAADAAAPVTFHKDIIGMIQRNCLECHREGEIGPFAMESYQEVVGWAETMLETMENQRMPPWHASPEFGEFQNSRHLPAADLQLFREWIAGGLVEGDPAQSPPAPEFTEGWQLPREPDLVVDMRNRPFVVPKAGVVEYQYFVVDIDIDEDRWISAAEVQPGNAAVVHHAIVFVRPPDGSRFRGLGWLGAYVPGQRAQVLPPGHARFLPAGSKLVFQMHYTPNGSVQSDMTRVGINFVEEREVTDEVFTLVGINHEFEIPPSIASHVVEADVPWLPENGSLLAVTPHMHFRGKSFKLYRGEDRDQVMLHVPNYDFNWQHTYVLAEPQPLDDLKRLSFDVVFDNSSANPFNPDPQTWVTWGDQTWEEMAVAFFEVSQPRNRSQSNKESRDSRVVDNNEVRRKVDNYVTNTLAELDKNRDGIIRRGETGIVLRRWNFELWDLDGDDRITEAELREVAERRLR